VKIFIFSVKHMDFLTQNYLPFSTHRSSLSSSVCQEVCSIVARQVVEVDKQKGDDCSLAYHLHHLKQIPLSTMSLSFSCRREPL